MPTSNTRKKAASGNPAVRAQQQVSSAADFKTAAAAVELPSGKVVKIKRLGLVTLISENLLGDQLTGLAQKAVDAGKGIDPAKTEELAADPAAISQMLLTFDAVTLRTWVQPRPRAAVYPEGHERAGQPLDDEDRDDEILYVDEIDMDDKIFTFNYVSGGSSDLEQFRKELAQPMAGIPTGEGVAGTPVKPL
jgi:hypothetical protein